jgi:hypothetical protein
VTAKNLRKNCRQGDSLRKIVQMRFNTALNNARSARVAVTDDPKALESIKQKRFLRHKKVADPQPVHADEMRGSCPPRARRTSNARWTISSRGYYRRGKRSDHRGSRGRSGAAPSRANLRQLQLALEDRQGRGRPTCYRGGGPPAPLPRAARGADLGGVGRRPRSS